MKTTTLALILFLTGFELWARFRRGTNGLPVLPAFPNLPALPVPTTPAAPATPPATATPNGTAAPAPAGSASAGVEIPAYSYNFQGVDVNQVLDLYADLVGRTILRAGLPQASIVLHTQSLLTRSEAMQALQAVLALNGISLINVGDKFVKAVPSTDANGQAAPLDYSTATNLPELGSYVTHIVQLKYVKPSEMIPIIQPFAKLQNSILAIDSNGILVLRDYAENVKRMLEMIDQIDVSVPAEYISEVIPIRYAMAGDIANALGSLGGNGNGAVSIGGSGSAAPISGLGGRAGGAMGRQIPMARQRAGALSNSGCRPSSTAPAAAPAVNRKSSFLARPKSSPTSGATRCWFLPRNRTWPRSRTLSASWTCCFPRCSSRRSSWT